MDEVSIYNRALTTNELVAIYAAGNSGKCRTTALPRASHNNPKADCECQRQCSI